MNKIYALPEDGPRGGIYRRILLLTGKNRGAWQTLGAAVGLFGGLLSIALGVLVWAVVGLIAPAGALGPLLDAAGTVLFVLPLPLLALGAHCLDLLEKKPSAPPPRRRRLTPELNGRGRRPSVESEPVMMKAVQAAPSERAARRGVYV